MSFRELIGLPQNDVRNLKSNLLHRFLDFKSGHVFCQRFKSNGHLAYFMTQQASSAKFLLLGDMAYLMTGTTL